MQIFTCLETVLWNACLCLLFRSNLIIHLNRDKLLALKIHMRDGGKEEGAPLLFNKAFLSFVCELVAHFSIIASVIYLPPGLQALTVLRCNPSPHLQTYRQHTPLPSMLQQHLNQLLRHLRRRSLLEFPPKVLFGQLRV